MFAATLAGTLATALVLVVCRWDRVSPSVKVWLCRAALLKWPLGLVGIGVPVVVAAKSAGAQPASWIALAMSFVFVVWLVGAVVALIESVLDWSRARRAMRLVPRASTELQDKVTGWKARMRLRTRVDLRAANGAPTAVMYAPTTAMVLPSDASDFAIAHELAHIKNRDLAWVGFASCVNVLFWFHPWMDTLHREMRLWQDVLADSRAIALTSTKPADAVDEILTATRPQAAFALSLGADAAFFARRFTQLYRCRKSLWASLVACAFVAVSLVPLKTAQEDQEAVAARVPVAVAVGDTPPIATMSTY